MLGEETIQRNRASLNVGAIGGGVVRRTFETGGKRLVAGERLTRDFLLAMPTANRNALIERGFVVVWPASGETGGGERYVISRGFGKFDVIEGKKMNAEPMTREEAEKLAGIPQDEKRRQQPAA